jgi:hypothetical protein
MFYHVTYKLIDSITGKSVFNLIGIEAANMIDAEVKLEKIIPSLNTSFNYDTIEIVEIKEDTND